MYSNPWLSKVDTQSTSFPYLPILQPDGGYSTIIRNVGFKRNNVVKVSLCLTKHQVLKTCEGVEVKLHTFLASILDGELHSPAAYPRGKVPGTHWIGGWLCLTAGLDAVEKRKIPLTAPSKNQTPVVRLIA